MGVSGEQHTAAAISNNKTHFDIFFLLRANAARDVKVGRCRMPLPAVLQHIKQQVFVVGPLPPHSWVASRLTSCDKRESARVWKASCLAGDTSASVHSTDQNQDTFEVIPVKKT